MSLGLAEAKPTAVRFPRASGDEPPTAVAY